MILWKIIIVLHEHVNASLLNYLLYNCQSLVDPMKNGWSSMTRFLVLTAWGG